MIRVVLSKAATTLSFLFAVLFLLSLPGAGSEGNFANYKRVETNTGVSLSPPPDSKTPAAAGFSYSRWLASGRPAAHENHTSGTFILKTAVGDIYRSRLTAAWRDVGARALNIEPLLRDELLLLANNKDSHWQSAWKNHREALLTALVDGTSDALLGGVLESGRALSGVLESGRALSRVRHLEVDFRTKLGKRPGSFGVNAILALHERADDATGLQLRGFFGNKFKGANAGVFYRRALGDNLLGGNVFLDYENVDVGGDFWRWSLGAEWRSPYVEIYGNRYLGITGGKRQLVDGQYIYTADGTEVELVLKAPYASWLSGVLSYYRWDGEYGDKVDKGFRYGIRADRRLGGFSFELQYEDPEVGKGSWGGRVSYSHDFAKGAESASSTQALTFDPRAHFFDAVRREYTQRIRRSAVLSGGVLVGYLGIGATAVVRGDALTLSLSRDGDSLVANLIQGGVTLLDTVALNAGYRFNAASPLTVSTAPAGATISISSGKWSINLKSELIFSQDSSTVQLLTGTLGIVYNAGGLSQVSLADGPTLHLLSAILTVGNGAPLSTNLQFGGGDGSLALNAGYTLSVQVNGGRLTVYLAVGSFIIYTPGAGELILIYLAGGTTTTTRIGDLIANIANAAALVSTGYTGMVGSLLVSGREGNPYTYTLAAGGDTFAVEADGVLSLTAAQNNAVILTLSVQVGDGGGGDSLQVMVGYTLRVADALVFLPAQLAATITTYDNNLVLLTASAIGAFSVVSYAEVSTDPSGFEGNFAVLSDSGVVSVQQALITPTTLSLVIRAAENINEVDHRWATLLLTVIAVDPSALNVVLVNASAVFLAGETGVVASVSVSGGAGAYTYAVDNGFAVDTDGLLRLTPAQSNAATLTATMVVDDAHDNTDPVSVFLTLTIAELVSFNPALIVIRLTTHDSVPVTLRQANLRGGFGTPGYALVSTNPSDFGANVSVEGGGGIVLRQTLSNAVTAAVYVRGMAEHGGEATLLLTVIAADPPLLEAAFDDNAPVVLTNHMGLVATVIAAGGKGDYAYGLPGGLSDNARFRIGTDGQLILATAPSAPITLTAVVTVNDEHPNTPAQTLSLTLGVQEGLLASVVNGTATVFTGYTGLIGSVLAQGGDGNYGYTLPPGEGNFIVGTDGRLSLNTSSADATTLTVGIKVDDGSAETTPVTASHTLAIISPSALTGSIVGASVFVLTGYAGIIGTVSGAGGDGDYTYDLSGGLSDVASFRIGTAGQLSLLREYDDDTLLTVGIVIEDNHVGTAPFTTNHTLRIAGQLRFGATTAFQVTTYDTGAIATIQALGTVGTPAYTRVSIIPASMPLHISVHSDSGIVSIQQGLPSPVTLSLIIRAAETVGGIDREATLTLTVIAVDPPLLTVSLNNNAPVVLIGYTGSVAAVIASGGKGDYAYGLPSGLSDFSIGTDGRLSLATAQSVPIMLTAVVTVNDEHRKNPAQTLSLTLGVFAPFLANASAVVLAAYMGAVASITNAPPGGKFSLVAGGGNFTVGTDGLLRLTVAQNSAITLTASVQISAGETPLVTLGYTLRVAPCSFFSGCQPFVNFSGAEAAGANGQAEWQALSAPLALSLIAAGADVNERFSYIDNVSGVSTTGDNTPLLAAARYGTPVLASVLLDNGADVDATIGFIQIQGNNTTIIVTDIRVLFAGSFFDAREPSVVIRFASLFLDNGAYVNGIARYAGIPLTPLDALNFQNHSSDSTGFIKGFGAKCLNTCRTVNGVRDITLAPVSFSPASLTVTALRLAAVGNLYTVRAASGLGTLFNYRVISVFPADLASSFDLISVDVNNARLSLNAALDFGQTVSIYVEATDNNPSGDDKATLRYIQIIPPLPAFVNASAYVLTAYTGAVASIANVPPGGKLSVVAGGGNFTVGTDGVLSLTAIHNSAITLTASVQVSDGGTLLVTLGLTVLVLRPFYFSPAQVAATIATHDNNPALTLLTASIAGASLLATYAQVSTNPAGLSASFRVSSGGVVNVQQAFSDPTTLSLFIQASESFRGIDRLATLLLTVAVVDPPMFVATLVPSNPTVLIGYRGLVAQVSASGDSGPYTYTFQPDDGALTVGTGGLITLLTALATPTTLAAALVAYDDHPTTPALTLSLTVVALRAFLVNASAVVLTAYTGPVASIAVVANSEFSLVFGDDRFSVGTDGVLSLTAVIAVPSVLTASIVIEEGSLSVTLGYTLRVAEKLRFSPAQLAAIVTTHGNNRALLTVSAIGQLSALSYTQVSTNPAGLAASFRVSSDGVVNVQSAFSDPTTLSLVIRASESFSGIDRVATLLLTVIAVDPPAFVATLVPSNPTVLIGYRGLVAQVSASGDSGPYTYTFQPDDGALTVGTGGLITLLTALATPTTLAAALVADDDHPNIPAVTLSLTVVALRAFLVNASAVVLASYTGPVASIVAVANSEFSLVFGDDRFSVGTDGVLSLTAVIAVPSVLTASIVIEEGSLSVTLGYTLSVRLCSFFSGCQPFVNFDGAAPGILSNSPGREAWRAINVPLAQLLIATGADVNERSSVDDDTPLLAAIRYKSLAVVSVLVTAGGDVHAVAKASHDSRVFSNLGFYYLVLFNSGDNANSLIPFFIGYTVDVNQQELLNGLFYSTPLDTYNRLDRGFAAALIKAAGAKCFFVCNAGDITLASVSFSPAAVAVTAAAAAAAGNLYTVQAASGLGTRFSYQAVSVFPASLASSFSLLSVDVNSALLSLNSALGFGQAVSIYIEVTDNNPLGDDKATLQYIQVIPPAPAFVNASAAVLTAYTGVVASITNVLPSSGFTVVFGDDNFAVSTDGLLSLTAIINVSSTLTASIVVDVSPLPLTTLGYTLTVAPCSFFSGCRPLVNYDGAMPGGRPGSINPHYVAWQALNVPLAQSLIAAGADVNERVFYDGVRGNETPILSAARNGIPALISLFLDNNADVNAIGATPLSNSIFPGAYNESGIFDYLSYNARSVAEYYLLSSLFIDRGVDVNRLVIYISDSVTIKVSTPLDNYLASGSPILESAVILRAVGAKCLQSCMTVNGVRDITLAPVSFSPASLTVTALRLAAVGNLYTVRAATGLGTSFNYQVLSVLPASLSSSFSLLSVNVHNAILSLNAALDFGQTVSIYVEATDNNPSGDDKATLRYIQIIPPLPAFVNASAYVLTAYTGAVASIANVPSGGKLSLVAGGGNFTVGTDGVLSLTATILVLSVPRATVVVYDGSSTLIITLNRGFPVVPLLSFSPAQLAATITTHDNNRALLTASVVGASLLATYAQVSTNPAGLSASFRVSSDGVVNVQQAFSDPTTLSLVIRAAETINGAERLATLSLTVAVVDPPTFVATLVPSNPTVLIGYSGLVAQVSASDGSGPYTYTFQPADGALTVGTDGLITLLTALATPTTLAAVLVADDDHPTTPTVTLSLTVVALRAFLVNASAVVLTAYTGPVASIAAVANSEFSLVFGDDRFSVGTDGVLSLTAVIAVPSVLTASIVIEEGSLSVTLGYTLWVAEKLRFSPAQLAAIVTTHGNNRALLTVSAIGQLSALSYTQVSTNPAGLAASFRVSSDGVVNVQSAFSDPTTLSLVIRASERFSGIDRVATLLLTVAVVDPPTFVATLVPSNPTVLIGYSGLVAQVSASDGRGPYTYTFQPDDGALTVGTDGLITLLTALATPTTLAAALVADDDHPTTPTVTLSLTVVALRAFLVNVSAAVLTLYKGPVASIASLPGSNFRFLSGGNNFAVGTAGVIRLTAKIRDSNFVLPYLRYISFAIEVDDGIVSTTLSHVLKVGPCSFFSDRRCLVFVDYSGGEGDILNRSYAMTTWTGFNVSLVRAFVAAGADVNEVWFAAGDDRDIYNHTPLLAMARFGSPAVVSALLNAGARVNAFAAHKNVVTRRYKDSGVLEYVLPNTVNAANIPLLVSLFVDYGVNVNFRGTVYSDNPVSLDITPLDRFNDNRNKFNDNRFILAADIIRAVGAKCLFTCLTVDGVRDITLASVSFASPSVMVTAAATFTGDLYTVQAASGLGTQFSYQVESVSPSSSETNFSLRYVDVNSVILRVDPALGVGAYSVTIKATDNNPLGDDTATLKVQVNITQ